MIKKKAWHSFSIKKTLREIDSRSTGLTEKEAKERLKKFGLNTLPQEKPPSKFKLFFNQIKSPLIYILLIAGIVTLVLGEYTDSIVIFGAVFLNTIVGYFQEKKANQALRELKRVLQTKVILHRSGRQKEVLQKDVALGDIVFLRAGNKAPADCRIIQAHNLKINEAALTGEWLPATKKTEEMPPDATLADRDNMAFMGTVVESGWGKAVVVSTGIKTAIGEVAKILKEEKEKRTPYQKKLSRFSKVLGLIIVVISLAIFIEGILAGVRFVEMFAISVAVAVAAIPEGLPVAMTVILAIGMERILKRKGLVRKLASAETLGSTSIILTDKTGTLTEAKMRIAGIFTGTKELLNDGYKFDKKIAKDSKDSHMQALRIATLCNESFIENFEDPTEKWIIRGRPTEKALLLGGIQAGLSRKELLKEQPIIDHLLFDPGYQYAMSLHKLNKEKNALYIVGSPDKLLEMSSCLYNDGKKEKLLLSDFEKLKEKYNQLTQDGLRVLAAGYRETKDKEINRKKEEKNKSMVFVGFLALHDPIRKGTKEVMEICRKAGMKPIILTGDHKLTALAVANKLGFKIKEKNVLEGKDLYNISDKNLIKKIKDIHVFARVEPTHKLRVVQAWQGKGEVVAMTGDGINDAPALKRADIGLALGSGTDVAKESSDLVLLNDNFSIIVAAVEEGRAIIDNIRKVITYLLSDSFAEVTLIGVSLLLGWPLPVLAVQILWVNLIEDGPMGIALAFEPKEKDIMKQKPKSYSLFLLNKEMKTLIFIIGFITNFLLLGLFFYLLKYSNYEIEHIRSIVFAGLTISSLFYIFSCKSLRRNLWKINLLSNKFMIYAWFFGIVMLVSAFYLPIFQTLLKTVPLNLFDWGLILGLGIINAILIELTKYYFIARRQT